MRNVAPSTNLYTKPRTRHSMTSTRASKLVPSILTLAAVCLISAGCNNSSVKAGGPAGRGRGAEGGPVPVVVAMVTQNDVPINVDVIGNVEAYSTISVKAQVGGELTKVSFHEGDFVK